MLKASRFNKLFLLLAIIAGTLLLLPRAAHAQKSGISTASIAPRPWGRSSADLPESEGPYDVAGKFYLGGAHTAESGVTSTLSQGYAFNAAVLHRETGVLVGVIASFTNVNAEGEWSGDYDNAAWSVGKVWEFKSPWISKLATGVGGVLPISQASHERTFRGSFGPYVSAVNAMGPWVLQGNLSYSHGTYGVATSADNPHSVAPDVWKLATAIDFNHTKRLQSEFQLVVLEGVNFEGAQSSHALWDYSLTYNFTKWFGVDGGFGTFNNLVAPNGHYDQLNLDSSPPLVVFSDLVFSL